MIDFVHLHVHSEFSLLDGAIKISDLIKHCVDNNIKAIAVTDHGNMYASLRFAEACKKAKIKYIIGCEMYVTENHLEKSPNGSNDHLVLLAKNKIGYHNLIKLDSIAFVDGFYYKPRIDYKLLEQYSEGLICLSGCLAGTIQKLLVANRYEEAREVAQNLKRIFGDDFYLEIQDHGLDEDKILLPLSVKLAEELNIQLVATNDAHYVKKEDAELQDVLMCIQMKRTLSDSTRMKFQTDEFYLKSGDEMAALFPNLPQAISNTCVIADKVTEECFDLNAKGDPIKDNSLIPGYTPDDGSSPDDYLVRLTNEGLASRYSVITDEIRKRADYELNVIISMKFPEYYLIVWDFINWSKQHGIPVGPGRGSGVGSIVAYAIGITDVDPIKYDLIFERFLNPERVTMPDFDIDFCTERRGEVVEYVREKYGAENVAQIITFGTLAAKAVIKDVGRVLGVPYSETDKCTKVMDGKSKLCDCLGYNLAKARKAADEARDTPVYEEKLEKLHSLEAAYNRDVVEIYNSDASLKRVIDLSVKLEGMPRNTSMHAAGVVICRKPISSAVPLSRNGEDITTQFYMKEVESVGLLKMDFLALATLTDIKKCCDYVFENYGVEIDFDKLGYDNQAAYDLIAEGDTDGVFQLEQGGMKKFMMNLKPNCLEDLIAGISLYRPGPMKYIDEYVENKHNPSRIKYATELLKPILCVTNGITIYQEQVMRIFQDLAGFSLGQADLVRRAMSKKDLVTLQAQRKSFIEGNISEGGNVEGAMARGVPEAVASKLFADLQSFASYAFNKSHAAAYAVVAYRTAYLKRFYVKEFLAALLNNRISKSDEITKYLMYCKKKNIVIYGPDVNKSKTYFSVQDDGIRFGLSALKGVGVSAIDLIIEERKKGEFVSFENFIMRSIPFLNKRILQNLIFSGAFDAMGYKRAQLMAVSDMAYDRANKIFKQKNGAQLSLFDNDVEESTFELEYPEMPEYELYDKLSKEKQVLGVYVSGHPFEKFAGKLSDCNFTCEKLLATETDEDGNVTYTEIVPETEVVFGGIISDFKRTVTRSGDTMAFVSVGDLYGNIECVFFPNAFKRYNDLIVADKVVVITGKLDIPTDKSPVIKVETVKELDMSEERETLALPVEKKRASVLWIKADNMSDERFYEMLNTLASYEGESTVKIMRDGQRLTPDCKIYYCEALKSELLDYLDNNSLVFKN